MTLTNPVGVAVTRSNRIVTLQIECVDHYAAMELIDTLAMQDRTAGRVKLYIITRKD